MTTKDTKAHEANRFGNLSFIFESFSSLFASEARDI